MNQRDANQVTGTVATAPPVESRRPRWLVCRRRRTDAALRLYCFPHSGGSPGEYVRWADDLPGAEVWGVQLPARGSRLEESPLTRMGQVVDALMSEVEFQPPFVFFGHSLGALTAYETARALHRAQRAIPEHLVLSAHPAPDLPRVLSPVHELPDEELLAAIEQLYGSLPDILHSDAELQQLILPGHRGDFEIVETYRHTRGDPLPCPATVVGGTLDTAREQDLTAWRDVLGGRCQVRMLPGDHFYFRPDPQPLLRLLTEILRSHGAAL